MNKEPKPEHFTAIIDTREKTPFDLSPLKTERGSLDTGDYTIKGLEKVIALERKSLQDLVQCVGNKENRERFERECQRLLAYPVRAIIVEASWADLEMGAWRGKITPQSVCGSVLGWMAQGLPILLGGNARCASKQTARLLFIAARREYRKLISLSEGLN